MKVGKWTLQLERLVPEKAAHMGKILYGDMERCDLFKHASAMSYVTLFSLVPSLAATFTLVALFKPFLGEDSVLFMKLKSFVLSNLAAGSGETVIQYLENFLANLDLTKIGLTGFVGIIISLVLLLRQIELALNRIWMVKRPRNIFARFVYFWTIVTLGTFVIGLAIGILSGFNLGNILPFLNPGHTASASHGFLSSLSPWIACWVLFTLLYKVVPNCHVPLKFAALGALPASIFLILASRLYGFYAGHLTNYKAVYGAVAALPVFLLWLYIIWCIVLLGAVVAWRSEQGFELSEDMDDESPHLTPIEKYRNHQLQALVPYMALVGVYQRFTEGGGKGITPGEMAIRWNIPLPWIEEAVEILLEKRLIVLAGCLGPEQDLREREMFPAFPADSATVAKFHESLSEPTRQWFNEWKHQWPTDIKSLIQQIWERGGAVELNLCGH